MKQTPDGKKVEWPNQANQGWVHQADVLLRRQNFSSFKVIVSCNVAGLTQIMYEGILSRPLSEPFKVQTISFEQLATWVSNSDYFYSKSTEGLPFGEGNPL